jgi:predicted XRE-type DNA-binding protein
VTETRCRERPRQASEEFREAVEAVETKLRNSARGLLAEHGVSQAVLAVALEISQSSVSHMLTDRTYGLTTTELRMIEALCKVEFGTLYRLVGLIEAPSVERQVYDIPGITAQSAEAIVAAIQAVKANTLRQAGRP